MFYLDDFGTGNRILISHFSQQGSRNSDCHTIKYGHFVHTLDLRVFAYNMAVNGYLVMFIPDSLWLHAHQPVLSSCPGL
jgi:hypothetical protein